MEVNGMIEALEAELASDLTDDRCNDDDWWTERRSLYVQLYTLVCRHGTPTFITAPPARSDEQTELGQDAARLQAEIERVNFESAYELDGLQEEICENEKEAKAAALGYMTVRFDETAIGGELCTDKDGNWCLHLHPSLIEPLSLSLSH
jgi:hypothetical protein